VLAVLLAVPGFAATLTGIDIDGSAAETRLLLRFDGAVEAPQPRFIDKRRIIVDFADMAESVSGTAGISGQEILPGQGVVRQVRYAKRGEAGLRVVLDLAADSTLSGARMEGDTFTMVVTGIGEGDMTGIPVPRLKPGIKPRRIPVIVIDPGHGGHDPGAIGVAKTREKTLTFAASKTLAKMLRATNRYKVVMTRDTDVYIAHEERLKIARLAGADLFISIHADSTANTEAQGASVYTLADRAMNRSRRLVQFQNWIMDVDLGEQSTEVGDILVDLAQRNTATQSDRFADILLPKLSKRSRLVRNSHRRAGYFVLLAPDVPAVLLEMGFLSNPTDEANLLSANHREDLMEAVVDSIDAYFDD